MSETFSFGEGITGWAVDHGEAVLANQAHLDPRVRFVPGTPIEPEALIAVPLIARGRLKGTLNIYRVGENAAFSDEEFLLAKRFGDAAALAIDNAHIRARLEHQAETDGLTGLYNHRAFHDRLRQELVRASAAHETVALVMLDLDDFKKVNDVYGHGIGDQLLHQVSDVLRASVGRRTSSAASVARSSRSSCPRETCEARWRSRSASGPARQARGRRRRQVDRLDRRRGRGRRTPPTRASSSPARRPR
jgi:GGDEF domain-containing protein